GLGMCSTHAYGRCQCRAGDNACNRLGSEFHKTPCQLCCELFGALPINAQVSDLLGWWVTVSALKFQIKCHKVFRMVFAGVVSGRMDGRAGIRHGGS
ncbi:MAG: hypothetical protein ACLFMY_07890, partial [Guyparkeria sp.]|uniref:hypothetical protein n=1 Tax=Guyparkeria sp. TaxID=2035736 RepID=UPI00397B9FD4